MHILQKKEKITKKSPTKTNPQKRTKFPASLGYTEHSIYIETQLYNNKLNYLMSPFASQVKKGYRIKHFKLFIDRNLLHN